MEPFVHKLSMFFNKEIISQSVIALFLRALGIGLGFLAHAIFAKSLGAGSYGSYALAITIVSILSAVCLQGFDLSAQRFIPSYKVQNRIDEIAGFFSYSMRRVLLTSIFFALLLALTPVVTDRAPVQRTLLLSASLLLIITSMMQYFSSILRAHKKVLLALIPIDVIRTMLLVIAGCFMFFWPAIASSLNAILLTLVASIICLILIVFFYMSSGIRTYSAKANIQSKSDWFRVSMPLYAATLFGLMQTHIDILLVGFFTNNEDIGVYSLASRIATLVWLGGYAVSTVSGAIMSEKLALPDSKKQLHSLFRTIATGQLLYTVPVTSILLIFAPEILAYFGNAYTGGVKPLIILASAFSVAALSGPVGVLMSVSGCQKQSMWISGIAIVAQITLSLILIPAYGIVGAAIATAICFVGRVLTMLVFTWLNLNIDCSVTVLLRKI